MLTAGFKGFSQFNQLSYFWGAFHPNMAGSRHKDVTLFTLKNCNVATTNERDSYKPAFLVHPCLQADFKKSPET